MQSLAGAHLSIIYIDLMWGDSALVELGMEIDTCMFGRVGLKFITFDCISSLLTAAQGHY